MGVGDENGEMSFATATNFLTMLALTTGRLLQGGAPNQQAAATQVLRDWNSGKIPYYTPVPDTHPSVQPSDAPGAEGVGDTKIVDTWKPAFDLGGLWDEGDKGAWGENDDDIMAEDRFVDYFLSRKGEVICQNR
jgi:nuclear GTP-binding protein